MTPYLHLSDVRADLVKVSFQYAAEEAEHRVLANYAAGKRPANDLAFAPALYGTVAEFAAALRQLGVVGGSGPAATYPGPGAIDPTNVTNRTPDGQVVSCTAPGMPGLPNTGGGGGSRDNLQLLALAGLGTAAAGLFTRRLAAHPEHAAPGTRQ